jgi:hypothetical protein
MRSMVEDRRVGTIAGSLTPGECLLASTRCYATDGAGDVAVGESVTIGCDHWATRPFVPPSPAEGPQLGETMVVGVTNRRLIILEERPAVGNDWDEWDDWSVVRSFPLDFVVGVRIHVNSVMQAGLVLLDVIFADYAECTLRIVSSSVEDARQLGRTLADMTAVVDRTWPI